MAALSRPPGLPSLVEGFLNLGGAAVPVIRLARLFNLPNPGMNLYTPLVVLHAEGRVMAAAAERVVGVFRPTQGAAVPLPPEDTFNGCAEGLLRIDDRSVCLLRVDRILLRHEQERLVEYTATEQQRLSDLEKTTEGANS